MSSSEDLDFSETGPTPMYQDATQMGLARLERKVDKITTILNKFILFEERQSNQREEIDGIHTSIRDLYIKVEANEKQIQKWINLGVGGWTVIIMLWSIYTVVYKP